ncbi:MAG: T9SS C-terminal target domain-containing protein [Bacteroidales bacterium]|nr:MAG: T9SS C-terminal target domain-containing protein [Bacteroidales bacterium]
MRTKIILLLALLLVGIKNSNAQAPDWTRVLQANTYGQQSVNVVDVDANSLYTAASISGPITFEGTNYTSVGYRDLLLIKASNIGNITWIKQVNALANGTIYANAIKVDASENIFVAGTFIGSVTIGNTITSSASVNSFIAKFDANGNGLWVTAFLSTGTGSTRIAIDGSGNAYLIGTSSKLLKFNGTGVKQWEQSFPDRTLQAIAIYGSNLYLGGCLQSGTTNFGTIPLTSLGSINTGFLVKADLDGAYNNSLVIDGSTATGKDGSTVTDIICDNSGNLIITGGYVKDLILGAITNTNTNSGHYTYIAKCDNNLVFTWAKSSSELNYTSTTIFLYRVFFDNSGNIYQYGINSYRIDYGSVSIMLGFSNQFLFKFDSNGNPIVGSVLTNSNIDRLTVYSDGKVFLGKHYTTDGSTYGNFNLTQLHNDLTLAWEKTSSNSLSGTVKVNYIKHDTDRNTYICARILGHCNYFGTTFNTNTSLTVISKHDINGNLLWVNQIGDISPHLLGSSFVLDKDNNILTVGVFKTSLTIGTTTLTSLNSNYEGYVAKYNSSGVFQWVSKMNLGDNVSYNITVATDNNSNVLVSGVKTPENYIVKFNSSGEQLWAKSFPMESYYFSQVTTDANNNIYLTSETYLNSATGSTAIGTITLNQSDEDGCTALVKFDPNGNAIWANMYGKVNGATRNFGFPCDSKTDALGNTYIWGWCENNSIFGSTTLTNPFPAFERYSYYLAKINTSGDVVWAKAIYENKYAFNYGDLLDLDKNGNVYIGGHFIDKISVEGAEYIPEGLTDFFVIKYNESGTFNWIKTIASDAPKNGFINSLGVFDENTLSIAGNAGKNPTLGSTAINSKGGSNGIIATLGNLLYLTTSSNTLTVAAAANSTNTFNITSNISWTANSDQTWLTVSSASGSGNATITITATANPTTTSRTANVTISGDGVSDKTITVTQDAGEAVLSVSTNTLTVAAAANSTNTFNITSNISWTANSDQTWLTASSASGSGNATITLTAASNPNASTRTANVTVSGTNVTSKTVTVTQDAGTSGIDDIGGLKVVNIFPNPSRGYFTLGLNHYNNEAVEVSICNTLGNIVKEFTLQELPENYKKEVDLGNIAKGIYFVIVKTNKNKVVRTITIIN